jgi:hypothetical protein
MPVELCACARAMDPSRRAYRAPLLQSLNTHRLAPTPYKRQLPVTRGPTRVTTLTLPLAVGYNLGRYFYSWVGSAGRPGSALTPLVTTLALDVCAGNTLVGAALQRPNAMQHVIGRLCLSDTKQWREGQSASHMTTYGALRVCACQGSEQAGRTDVYVNSVV